jgi:peptide/nickel transport system substrate-binding protein
MEFNMFLKISILFAMIFSLSACTKSNEVKEGSIRIALESAPKTLDPRRATDANGQRMATLLFQSFVRLGPEMEIIGDAAQTWDLTESSLKMKLHPNIKFSDGKELTKEDILFSFNEYRKEGSIFAGAYKEIKEIKVDASNKEGFQVDLMLAEPSATLLTDLSPLKILPKSHVEKMGADFQNKIIGSGPYTLDKKSVGEFLLKKNPHYIGKVANNELLFKVIKDDNTRYLKVLKGNIDVAPNVLSPQSSKKLLSNNEFTSFQTAGLAMNYLLLNLKDKALSNKDFRKALGAAIDRKSIIDYKLEGLASPASSILTPENPFFHKELQIPQFNIDKAKEILSKIPDLPKTLSIKTSNKPSAVENAKILANQIGKLGIEVKIESYEWGTFFEDIKKGNYQLATMRWVGATDPDIYRIAFHSDEMPPGRNRGFYQNKQLDSLLDKGTSIVSTEKRIEHYRKVQEIIAKDLPIIPLWYNDQINIVSKRIKGFKVSKIGDFSYFKDLSTK